MSKHPEPDQPRARYEFRVWGKHKKVRKSIASMATTSTDQTYDDCYLIHDDPAWNAKVRDNTLKLKQLVSEKKGFERWASDLHHTAESTPTPFDTLFEDLRLDRPQRGKKYNLRKEIAKLDPDAGVRAVFVTKHRTRYRIGNCRAEVTDIEVHDQDKVLRTISIEGDDLAELVKLRKKLGIKGEPNVPVHQLIEAKTEG